MSGKSKHNYYDHGDDQEQEQHQSELQAQAQAQLAAQAQGQGQHQSSTSESLNGNGNINGNGNGNLNGNLSANLNFNENISSTTVTVGVTVDPGMEGYLPTDDDFADVDVSAGSSVEGMFNVQFKDIMDDALDGEGNDVGNVFNQIANLQDNDRLENAEVKNDAAFTVNAKANGGKADADEGINGGGGGGNGGSNADADGGDGGNGERCRRG